MHVVYLEFYLRGEKTKFEGAKRTKLRCEVSNHKNGKIGVRGGNIPPSAPLNMSLAVFKNSNYMHACACIIDSSYEALVSFPCS